MAILALTPSEQVTEKLATYPPDARKILLSLRQLIIETAGELGGVSQLQESLKWGEPSYVSKSGSPIRIDWKSKDPDRVGVYFICTSRLIPTIKRLFGDRFSYDKDRAILLPIGANLPAEELATCFRMALRYHDVKHLPLLGE